MEKISPNLVLVDDKKKINHFQNLITYYKGEVFDQFEHDIRKHNSSLNDMLQEKAPLNEQVYRGMNKPYHEQISTFVKKN